MAVERRTDRNHTWAAWVGTTEDLRRLAETTRSCFESQRRNQLAQFDAETAVILASASSDLIKAHEENRRAISREILQDRGGFQCRLTMGDDEVVGNIDDVLLEIHPRTLSELVFVGDLGYSEKVELRFRKTPLFGKTVQLQVKSKDVDWARGTFTRLQEQVGVGKPWWAWVHAEPGLSLLRFATTAVFLGATLLAVWPEKSITPQEWALSLIYLTAICAVVATTLTSNTLRRLMFPPFELTDRMARSTGTGVAVYFLTLMAAIVTGIWINLVT